MQRDRERAALDDVGDRRPVRGPRPVRLGRGRDVGGRLGQGVLRLRQPDVVEGLGRGHRDLQRPGIRVAHVLRRRDDQPPGDEPRVLAGRDHRRQPVQGGVGVVAPQALDERGDGGVMAVARAVVGEDPLLGGGLDVGQGRGRRRRPRPRCSSSSASAIAPSSTLSAWRASPPRDRPGGRRRPGARVTPPVGPNAPATPRSSSSSARRTIVRDLVIAERLEAPHAQPGQQRRVHLEVRVLGRRADQGDRPVLDVRQERVLLALVEAVDLVDEQDRAASLEREPLLGLGDRPADLGDARHDRRHGPELGADGVGEEARERRLAGAGRAPQQEAREVAPRDRSAERAAIADEVALADELLERPRAHARGQRLPLGRRSEQGFGLGAGDGAPGRHAAMVSRGGRTAG